jgi:hypothetical protein
MTYAITEKIASFDLPSTYRAYQITKEGLEDLLNTIQGRERVIANDPELLKSVYEQLESLTEVLEAIQKRVTELSQAE